MAGLGPSSIDWDAHADESSRLLRELTPEESVQEFVALQAEFSGQLEETEALFRDGRARHLSSLQESLRRLDSWRGDPVKRLVDSVVALETSLDRAGIPSMVVGGLAVSVWGEPRLTRDVDVKVLLRRDEAERLLKALGPDYSSLSGPPGESLARVGFAFFRDKLGTRIDVLLADTSFDESALARAVRCELEQGKSGRVCAAEDLIVYKMISDRPRDRADAESVVRRQGDRLDDAYVERWLAEFERALSAKGLVAEYAALRRGSGPGR
jgi:hypothetical protein